MGQAHHTSNKMNSNNMNSIKSTMSRNQDKMAIEYILREAYGPECSFSNPKKRADEAIAKFFEISRANPGLVLSIQAGPKSIVFQNIDDEIIDDVWEQDEKPHKTKTVEEEEKHFKGAIKKFRNDEGILRYDTDMKAYALVAYDEFLPRLQKSIEHPLISLRKEDIRTWRWGEQKYYRLTFTNPYFEHHSAIEKAFGRIIIGETFLVKKEQYKAWKKMLHMV